MFSVRDEGDTRDSSVHGREMQIIGYHKGRYDVCARRSRVMRDARAEAGYPRAIYDLKN